MDAHREMRIKDTDGYWFDEGSLRLFAPRSRVFGTLGTNESSDGSELTYGQVIDLGNKIVRLLNDSRPVSREELLEVVARSFKSIYNDSGCPYFNEALGAVTDALLQTFKIEPRGQ